MHQMDRDEKRTIDDVVVSYYSNYYSSTPISYFSLLYHGRNLPEP